MSFIKLAIVKWILWLLVAGLVAACSNMPRQPSTAGIETTAGETTLADEDVELLPDPYLARQTPLPAQVRADFTQAQKAMEAEQWQQAQALLEQMTQNYPSLSGPFINLGLVHRRQDQFAQAADAFLRAIAANPDNTEAYNQLAILHREQGEFAEAEQLYLKALEVWPHNPIVHRNLGILYDLYMGRFADALRHYQMSQKVAQERERRVEGWIVDLQRRMAEQQAAVK